MFSRSTLAPRKAEEDLCLRRAYRFVDHDSWFTWLEAEYEHPDPTIPAFERLIEKGCARDVLIECMMLLGLSERRKLSKREVRKALAAVGSAAEWIMDVDLSDLMPVAAAVDTETLVGLLLDYEQAIAIALYRKRAGNKRLSFLRDDLIATLVRYVKHTTGRLFDQEVSRLIAASLPQRFPLRGRKRASGSRLPRSSNSRIEWRKSLTYTLDAHRQWKRRHTLLLKRETACERKWKRTGWLEKILKESTGVGKPRPDTAQRSGR